jgi:hypothetical protein
MYCQHCHKKLRAFKEDDWAGRRFHKTCYLELRERVEATELVMLEARHRGDVKTELLWMEVMRQLREPLNGQS